MLNKVENMDNIRSYLKIKQAAKYLGVSEMTLRRWDSSGKLKATRPSVNNYRLYKKSTLDIFLHNLGIQKENAVQEEALKKQRNAQRRVEYRQNKKRK